MALDDETRQRILAEQREANRRALELIAKEHPLTVVPFKQPRPNGPELPPLEAYAEEVSRETNRTGANGPEEYGIEPVQQPDILQWRDLMDREPPPRQWFIEHWLTPGATLLAGKGGSGKSLVAQTLLTALAVGQNYLAPIAEPKRVLMWACEDDHDEIWRRQIAIAQYFSTTFEGLDNLNIEPRVGLDNALMVTMNGSPARTALLEHLREQVNDLAIDVLTIDNVRQTFAANENSGHDPTSFVNALLGLVTDRPFSVLLLHHTSKATGSEFAGNMAWENAVRARWYLGPTLPDQPAPEEGNEPDPALRYLCRRKSNYSATDYLKLLYEGGVFKPQQEPGALTQRYSAARQAEEAQQAVLFAVRKAGETGSRLVRGYTSPCYFVKFMRELKIGHEIPKPALERALTELMAAGRVREDVVSRYANGNGAIGLVIAESITN